MGRMIASQSTLTHEDHSQITTKRHLELQQHSNQLGPRWLGSGICKAAMVVGWVCTATHGQIHVQHNPQLT